MRRLIGYARDSTLEQSLDLQFDDLKTTKATTVILKCYKNLKGAYAFLTDVGRFLMIFEG